MCLDRLKTLQIVFRELERRRKKYKKIELRWRCAFICFILLDATIHCIATACSIVAAVIEDSMIKLALTIAAGVISSTGIVIAAVIPTITRRERVNKNKKNATIDEQRKCSVKQQTFPQAPPEVKAGKKKGRQMTLPPNPGSCPQP